MFGKAILTIALPRALRPSPNKMQSITQRRFDTAKQSRSTIEPGSPTSAEIDTRGARYSLQHWSARRKLLRLIPTTHSRRQDVRSTRHFIPSEQLRNGMSRRTRTHPHIAFRVPRFARWLAPISGALKTEVVNRTAAARTK